MLLVFLGIVSPLWAFADDGLSGVAGNLAAGLGFASTFLSYVCYISGICLLFGAIIQYRLHRQNPLAVRLSVPIFYLILGATIFAVPFAKALFS